MSAVMHVLAICILLEREPKLFGPLDLLKYAYLRLADNKESVHPRRHTAGLGCTVRNPTHSNRCNRFPNPHSRLFQIRKPPRARRLTLLLAERPPPLESSARPRGSPRGLRRPLLGR